MGQKSVQLDTEVKIVQTAGVVRMARMDLYDYPKRLDSALKKVENDKGISAKNKRAILSFCRIRLAKGSSKARVAKVAYCLRYWAVWLGSDFAKANKEQLIDLIGGLENREFSEYTKYDFKIVLKMFFKWLKGKDEFFPPEISWLKPRLKNEKHKLPEDLLTDDEVLKMVDAARTLRDKAFVLVLYESGCRIGEMLTLKLKNVIFDQYGAVLRVTGKTGDRRVRIISSAAILASWVNSHPYANQPDAMLWPALARNKMNEQRIMSHASMYKMLKIMAEKAGIRKRIHPHLFRHSRATAMATKMTEAQMKEYFGWVQGSDMAATYVHLSGRDVDNTLLKMHGLVKEESTTEGKMSIRPCPRCKENNSPVSKFCTRCGSPVDGRMAEIDHDRKTSDEVMNKLMQDDEFKEFILKKILEKGLDKIMTS